MKTDAKYGQDKMVVNKVHSVFADDWETRDGWPIITAEPSWATAVYIMTLENDGENIPDESPLLHW